MAFSKQISRIIRSFDLTSILTRQMSEKVAYKPGHDYLLECFLQSSFARIISILPETFQKFLKLGGCSPPSPFPVPPARTPRLELGLELFLTRLGKTLHTNGRN